MDPTVVKWIGRIAIVAVVASGVWQAFLPALDARMETRFARELAAVRAGERRAVALGWALRRWTTLAAAPLTIMVAAANGLGRLDSRALEAIALPVVLAGISAVWQLFTTLASVRRIERTGAGSG